MRLAQNQYRGINAHLMSYFQAHSGWTGFHNNHIARIGQAISESLPPGYVVDTEQSLQIQEFHPDTVELDDEMYYQALVIYQLGDAVTPLGRPITRIELLSPSNKVGDGYLQYREKRIATLRSGLRLIEIDYLHQSPSPVKGLPRYPQETGSYPYNVTISDPVPSFDDGTARTFAFSVDTPIPVIDIPLAGDDVLPLDLNQVYQDTFTSINAYAYRVDYAQQPDRFDTYSPTDQDRIQTVMQRAKKDESL